MRHLRKADVLFAIGAGRDFGAQPHLAEHAARPSDPGAVFSECVADFRRQFGWRSARGFELVLAKCGGSHQAKRQEEFLHRH